MTAALLDRDTFGLVLGFCDLQSQLQLMRTCTAYAGDTRQHLVRHHPDVMRYIQTATHTRLTDDVMLDLVGQHSREPDWLRLLVQVWLQSVYSTVAWDLPWKRHVMLDAIDAPTTMRWSIPPDSHVRQHPCPFPSFCSHHVPTKLVLKPTGYKCHKKAANKWVYWLVSALSKQPVQVALYVATRVVFAVCDCVLWSWG